MKYKCKECGAEITKGKANGMCLCRICWRRQNDKKNAKKIKRQSLARRNKNPEKYTAYRKKWRAENPERSKMLDDLSRDRKRFGGNKQKALERDNFQCQECGMTQEQHFILYNHSLAVHHIDGKGHDCVVKNNDLDNLITLCFRCHMLVHKNPDKKTIKEFFEKINEWIVILSGDLEETDAGIVREEMIEFINKIVREEMIEFINKFSKGVFVAGEAPK